jgi:hypothetical protein
MTTGGKMNEPLTGLETLAIGKAVKADVMREISRDMPPGKYPVDFITRHIGDVTKHPNHESTVVQSAKPWLLCAILLSKVNVETREAVLREFAEAHVTGRYDDLVAQVKELAQDALTNYLGLFKKMVNGGVIAKIIVEKVIPLGFGIGQRIG